MSSDELKEWFPRVWEYREDDLYPSLFGPKRHGVFVIKESLFTRIFHQKKMERRWRHHGVFEFEPTPARPSWLYVTSGMSNDWDSRYSDSSKPSGMGCEFVMETPQKAPWAIFRLMHVMAFQILLAQGRLSSSKMLGDYDRLPLGGSIRTEPSALTHLMLAPPSGFARRALLESGPFEFTQLVGITDAEDAFARSHDGAQLVEILEPGGGFPVTNPERQSLVEEE